MAEVSDSSDSASEEAALAVELVPDIAEPAEVAAEPGAGAKALAKAGAKALPKPGAKAHPKAAVCKAAGKAVAKAKATDAQQLLDVRIMDQWGDRPIGSIKIDVKRKQFNAHCLQLGQPGSTCDHRTITMPECRLNRKVTASNKPLGKVRL